MRHSHAVVGFWLMHCLRRPAELIDAPLQDLFARAAAGELRVVEGAVYGLSEARRGPRGPAGPPHDGQAAPDPGALTGGRRPCWLVPAGVCQTEP